MRAMFVDESTGWTETEDLDAAIDACWRRDRLTMAEIDVERALHALIDSVVDDYEHIAARLDQDVEDLEAQALRVSRHGQSEPARSAESLPSQPKLYSIKQQVSMLRRYAMPLTGA